MLSITIISKETKGKRKRKNQTEFSFVAHAVKNDILKIEVFDGVVVIVLYYLWPGTHSFCTSALVAFYF